MLVLRDIMTRDVLTLGPELNLRAAIELLARHHYGGAPVVAGNEVVGVLSASDVLSLLASVPGVPGPRDEEGTALDEVETSRDDGAALEEPAFFAKLWDDCRVDLVERFERSECPEWDVLAEYDVAAAMTRPLLTLPSGTPVREGAEFLVRHGVHRVLVVDDGALAGIVTTTDIARAVADEQLGDDSPHHAADG